MKKGIITFLTLLAGIVSASADNVIKVSDVTVPQGMKGVIAIELENTDVLVGFQMKLTLPEGVSVLSVAKSNRFVDHSLGNKTTGQGTQFTSLSETSSAFLDNSGTFFTVTVQSEEGLEVGSKLEATITNIEFTKNVKDVDGEGNEILNAVAVNLPDVTFNITIGEPVVELDENATTLPEAMENVNVRVLRTINANEWGTICLPFAMTEAQTKETFGDDVKLAKFSSWSSEEDGEGAIVAINVGFTTVNSIEANVPLIIKTSSKISEFTVNGVDVDPDEEAKVQVGKKSSERGYMYGNYINGTKIPEENVFLSGGKFYYSVGETTMKAFRGYFEFKDVMDAYYDEAPSRMNIIIDGTTTDIQMQRIEVSDDRYYNVNGQRIQNPKKGLYIKGNKKVVIK